MCRACIAGIQYGPPFNHSKIQEEDKRDNEVASSLQEAVEIQQVHQHHPYNIHSSHTPPGICYKVKDLKSGR